MLEGMSPLCGDNLAQKSVSNYMPERVGEMVPFHLNGLIHVMKVSLAKKIQWLFSSLY